MKIKILNFGYNKKPFRAHYDDAGADVYVINDYMIKAGETKKIPLGFGLEIPNGYVGFIFPRSSLSSIGVVCELPPIDSGYRGEIHAIITNHRHETVYIKKYDRIGQLLIIPCIIADFIENNTEERGSDAFGSTGK